MAQTRRKGKGFKKERIKEMKDSWKIAEVLLQEEK